jgi:hypothetical protein
MAEIIILAERREGAAAATGPNGLALSLAIRRAANRSAVCAGRQPEAQDR